ncbi:hypothetical protein YC2023_016754 [Brassica napus]
MLSRPRAQTILVDGALREGEPLIPLPSFEILRETHTHSKTELNNIKELMKSVAPEKVVFHLFTNAMKSWFAMNMDNLRRVTVEVQKFEDFKWLNASYVPVFKQLQDSDMQSYYFSGHNKDGRTLIKFRNPKYLSMLNHLNAQLYLFTSLIKETVKE